MLFSDVTYYDIQALVDEELESEDKITVRAYIQTNISAQNYYAEICHQKYLLQKLWNHKNHN